MIKKQSKTKKPSRNPSPPKNNHNKTNSNYQTDAQIARRILEIEAIEARLLLRQNLTGTVEAYRSYSTGREHQYNSNFHNKPYKTW